MKILFVTGPSESGKTTLTRRLSLPRFELDMMFEKLVHPDNFSQRFTVWSDLRTKLNVHHIIQQYIRCWHIDNGQPERFSIEGCSLGLVYWYQIFKTAFPSHRACNIAVLHGPHVDHFKNYATFLHEFTVFDDRDEAFYFAEKFLCQK